jgi:hypothetical protein
MTENRMPQAPSRTFLRERRATKSISVMPIIAVRYLIPPVLIASCLAASLAIVSYWYAFNKPIVTSEDDRPFRRQEHRVAHSQFSAVCASAAIVSAVLLCPRKSSRRWHKALAVVAAAVGCYVIILWIHFLVTWTTQVPRGWQ